MATNSRSSNGRAGSKSANGGANCHTMCKATKHAQDFQVFLEAVERNQDGFQTMIDRIRERWQAKLERGDAKLEQGDAKLEGDDTNLAFADEGAEALKADFCLPMQGMRRAKPCPLFRHTCGAHEPERCMVSL